MRDASHLYRKTVVEGLSSPDQLDRLVTVTDARGWLALAGGGVVTGALVLWGLFGTVPTTVPAKGILVTEGGRVLTAMSPAQGIVDSLTVRLGERVRQDQPVATIRQTEAEQRLANTRALVVERERERDLRLATLDRELRAREANAEKRAAALQRSIGWSRQRIEFLEKQLAGYEDLKQRGFTTAEKIEAVRIDLNRARRELADFESEGLRLETELLTLRGDRQKEAAQLDHDVAEARRRVTELMAQIGQTSTVLAPADGRVTELRLSPGAVVGGGEALMSIETSGSGLQAVVFIPMADGKKVRPGMPARLVPDTVRREVAGMVIGRVASVSAFPATRQGIAAVLQNDKLVDLYMESGPPYEARIDLERADTASGYAWTSGGGPALDLTSGTTLEARLTVAEDRPAALILPWLKRITGTW